MKLLPQYSIRLLLGATALVAAAFSVVALAMRGHGWAVAVSAAVAGLVILLGVHALLFALVWAVSLIPSPLTPKRTLRHDSPFQRMETPPRSASPFGEVAVGAIVLDRPGAADETSSP